MTRYCIWNNKGGVGKTFLTYVLATEYAKQNPEKEVIIVDMCPQANVSEIILGGNGTGQKKLEQLNQNDRTIATYIKQRYQQHERIGNETTYFIQASEYNHQLPSNIFLLPGDVDLDICSGIINYLAMAPIKNAWTKSRQLLNDLLGAFDQTNNKKEKVYFIDCNPSFSAYTELAIISSTALIVPCTADNASMRGLANIFKLLYSKDDEEQFSNFSDKVREYGIPLPKVHHIILNRSRSHQKNASKAFTASIEELDTRLADLKNKYSNAFFETCPAVCNIKDGNTLATVINHEGQLLSEIQAGMHNVYGCDIQVNQSQIDELHEDVVSIVKQL
ncbi:MAG: ParA family protein [Akkermansia sp.]